MVTAGYGSRHAKSMYTKTLTTTLACTVPSTAAYPTRLDTNWYPPAVQPPWLSCDMLLLIMRQCSSMLRLPVTGPVALPTLVCARLGRLHVVVVRGDGLAVHLRVEVLALVGLQGVPRKRGGKVPYKVTRVA